MPEENVKDFEKSRKKKPESFLKETNESNSIKKVISVVSGKGGVGKSLITSIIAVMMRRKGYNGCGYYWTFNTKNVWSRV